ncbi:MAG: HYR domain-containing protein [Bacteroidota bacterium]
MKRKLRNLILVIGIPLLCFGNSFAKRNSNYHTKKATISISENRQTYTTIPDANFEAALSAYDDIPNDGQVPTDSINTIVSLNVSNRNIADLTGIQDFTALEFLDFNNNNVSSLDVSNNIALRILRLRFNNVTTLNISNNTNLVNLLIENNGLTSLDVRTNINLEELYVGGNSLTELDLSNNPNLEIVGVNVNNLTSLNMKNGNNTNISLFVAGNNPNLTCILVDDAAYSVTNWTSVDAQTIFSDTSCYTSIPDANFEIALSAYDDIPGDGQVPTPAIETITSLNVSNRSIADLTGIEAFTALTNLNCERNNLTTLDLQNNLNLQILNCGLNSITTLDLQQNVALENLICQRNNISNLNLQYNTALTGVNCERNSMTTLNVSNNPALVSLDCERNSIGAIDLTNSLLLETLVIRANPINQLNLSQNTALRVYIGDGTRISTLNFNTNALLETVVVRSNFITEINIKNQNNTNINNFDASSSPNLTCVSVDDVSYSIDNWTQINNAAVFTASFCNYTAIPDANFEARLNALAYDDIAADGQVPTSLIEGLISLDVSNQLITDLTGIEDFTALETLNANNNSLTTVDLSANVGLRSISIRENTLSSLDVTNNINLESIAIQDNNVASLDLSNNTALTYLGIARNSIATIDLTNNVNLSELFATTNGMTGTIDLSNNPNLTVVGLNGNNLEGLNVKNGNNTNINTFTVSGNPNLFCVLVDDVAYSNANWTAIDPQTIFSDTSCYTQIPDANFEAALSNLGYDDIPNDGQVPKGVIAGVTLLNVNNSAIVDFTGIEDFVSLTELRIGSNPTTSINLSNNTALEVLDAPDCDLTSINITGLTQLRWLFLSVNELTSLDLSGFPNLTSVALNNNELTELNIRNGANATLANIDMRSNANLTCVLIDDPSFIRNTWFVDNQTSYTTTNFCGYTAIPDANFEARLETLGYDDISGDGQVPNDLIRDVTILNLTSEGITDLTGIEGFTSLQVLNASDNPITAINISSLTQLLDLSLANTGITTLDTSTNTLLKVLDIDESSVTSLDISANEQLEVLDADDIGVLTDITFGNNALLKTIIVSGNQLTSIDLSPFPLLNTVRLNNNNLSTVNLKNGNNTAILDFTAVNNPNLTCISVDDRAYSNANWTGIDAQMFFSEFDCRYTAIPDANFEAALGADNLDDISGDRQVPTQLIENTETLLINNANITDLTGIEDFTALLNLHANGNATVSADLSNNTNLVEIDLNGSPISTINITQCTNLEVLSLDGASLSTIDLSNNAQLRTLSVSNTSITSLDVSANVNLETISCPGNALTALDLSNLSELNLVDVSNNNLTTLNIRNGNNTNMPTNQFDVRNNPNLTCILVSDVAYASSDWTRIDAQMQFTNTEYCYYTAIPDPNFEASLDNLGYDDIPNDGQVPTELIANVTSLNLFNRSIGDLTGIEDFTALQLLRVSDNNLTSLNLSANTQLRELLASNNQLTTLDLSSNTSLEEIQIKNNNLTSINLTGLTEVVILDLNSNPLVTINLNDLGFLRELFLNSNPDLTSIDLSNKPMLREVYLRNSTSLSSITFGNNPMLRNIVLSGAAITTIDVSTLTALQDLEVNNTGLTVLDVSANTLLGDLDASDTAITSLDLSANTSLNDIVLENTALSFLNVQNGNNFDVNDFNFRLTNNPNLFCVLVDNVNYSSSTWTSVDAQLTFSETFCRYTAIPDSNFEAALENLGYDDISGDGQVPTALIETVTSLNISDNLPRIQDVTGIEDFKALQVLNVAANNLTNLDLSSNTNLISVDCQSNSLTSVNVSGLGQLEELNCEANFNITSLDISTTLNLKKLICSDTQIAQLDLSNLSQLVEFVCNLNPVLNFLNVQNGNNTNVTNFNITGTPNLTCVIVDDVAYSTTNWTNIDATTNFTITNYCDYTAIPDTNFEAALEALGYDDISGDGQVPTALIETVTVLDVSGSSITNLSGIEAFAALTSLNLSYSDSGLTSVDLSNNSNLVTLIADTSNIDTLDLGTNTNYETIIINGNQLTDFQFPNLSNLKTLVIDGNPITDLDLSTYTALETFNCNFCNLSNLNIQNGNNTAIVSFQATNNPNLTCIFVDDAAFAGTNFTSVDAGVTFTDTNYCDYTAIPDANFEARLEALGYDDISGDGQVPTALIEVVTSLNVESKNISDLTGIEAFAALTNLNCFRNNLTSLDLQGNPLLETLNCRQNNLTNLNLQNNPLLRTINCRENSLPTLNLLNNPLLETFNGERNNLTSLDFQNNTALINVNAKFNSLTSVNIQNSTLLEVLDIQSNQVVSLDVSNNTALRVLDVESNRINPTIDVSNNTALTGLVIKFNNGITQLDVSQNTALQVLLCNATRIDSLDLSNNTQLTNVQADSNGSLVAMNVANAVNLIQIKVNNTNLASLDVSDCTALQELEVYNTQVPSLNLVNNPNVEVVNAANANLSSFTIKNGNNTIITSFNATSNPNLTCIEVDDVAYSTANWTNIDVQTSFDEFCRYTVIPDAAFEAQLESFGLDDISADGQVPTALIEAITSLTIGNVGITDITGIEDFSSLENLTFGEDTIITVNLSSNIQLRSVEFNDTTVNNLVLDNNPLLETIEFEGAGQSDITDLDLSNSPLLRRVDVNDVGLVNLSLPAQLPNLEILFISGNNFASLDASGYPALIRVSFSDNPNLSFLDLRNGNNTNILSANLINLPSLSCIVVDDVAYATTNFTNRDPQINFNAFDCVSPSLNCADITVPNDPTVCGANITIPMPMITDDVDCAQSDDLESYTEGPLLGQGGDWETWNPGTASESGTITTEQALSGTKSLKIEGVPSGGPQDMVFNLGNKDFGVWELTFHLYIPAGNSAYINMQKTEVSGTQFANQTAFFSNGSARYNVTGAQNPFNYPQDSWVEIKYFINLNTDYCEFFVNGTSVASHAFSDTTGGTGGLNTLGSITFYPVTFSGDPNPNATPEFYLDDISLCAIALNDYNNTADASDVYPIGTTDVTWSYTDAGGNTASCTQAITVNDTEAPFINYCPEDMTVNACEATINYDAPVALDNCETIAITGFTYLGNFNNKAYYLSDADFNGPNAFTDAEAQNGFVATIDSEELNQFLTDATNAEGTGSVIVGFTDRDEEGEFAWHNGSTSDYRNWNDTEPNDFQSGEDYVELRSNGRWNDINSTSSRKYVLEISGAPMIQTAGLASGSVFPLGTTTNTFEATDAAGNTISCSFDITVVPCVTSLNISPKIFLQGAALNPNTGEENLMRDNLRIGGLIPTRSPYADMLTCEPSVFTVNGNDAIVDWVWVELRDATDNTIVRHASSALLQRDGDVVAADGISPVNFSEVEETYYVAIKHRNHLGIMTNTAITFVDGATEIVDFTTIATFGSNAQTSAGMPSGVNGMWCGNANEDTVVQYSGTSPDTPSVLSEVLNDSGNFLNFPTFSLIGYNTNDINMDGVIQYSGTNPDTPFILQNVLAHPGNFLNFSTYQIIEQLPENISNSPE